MTPRVAQRAIPGNPKLYHITHIKNLPQISKNGCLWSDAKRVELNFDYNGIGMSTIKERRLKDIEVDCHPGTTVGQYVPFYFCPRSVMLYILHMANHIDLTYRGGQDPIAHLQFDMRAMTAWAESNDNMRWAFSDRNAGAYVASFFKDLGQLYNVNWPAVQSDDFRSPQIKEGKQAEFLVYDFAPWTLVEKIGVINHATKQQVKCILEQSDYQPNISIEKSWYF